MPNDMEKLDIKNPLEGSRPRLNSAVKVRSLPECLNEENKL